MVIAQLREELAYLRGTSQTDGAPVDLRGDWMTPAACARRGKAPPINHFTEEDPECWLDDWLPTLKRAVDWNSWTSEDVLIQLAGHLKGRALQKWNFLPDEERTEYSRATTALRS